MTEYVCVQKHNWLLFGGRLLTENTDTDRSVLRMLLSQIISEYIYIYIYIFT